MEEFLKSEKLDNVKNALLNLNGDGNMFIKDIYKNNPGLITLLNPNLIYSGNGNEIIILSLISLLNEEQNDINIIVEDKIIINNEYIQKLHEKFIKLQEHLNKSNKKITDLETKFTGVLKITTRICNNIQYFDSSILMLEKEIQQLEKLTHRRTIYFMVIIGVMFVFTIFFNLISLSI